ncbi:hypothetical protein A3B18_03810 [Candidatus Giovannonibacteria bacterium RIFCSPLOWO2_01_FULL_46_13]|uniref:Uncharacterized protein n=1 Tax=Candidatus Giovannonibacteria bacterium RIFCSPLOWO2_01_FULL_46_13 TaxID=1798352 RepID=A0A1F5X3I8_9BACT|nr:MAG: hypothetical protein A3B18_03810 [Candidatus Giovannonibacteria bacterium RIFCSPLOWO2_01_FULL_46_13]
MSLLVSIICRLCGSDFQVDPKTFGALGLRGVPKKCPSCCDKKQERPPEATVINRQCLQDFPAVRVCLPENLFAPFKAQNDDRPCLRAVIKGSSLGRGASWSGRLDIYCLAEKLPSVARVRVMEVTHVSGQRRMERHKDAEGAVPGVSLSHPGQPTRTVEVEYSPTYTYLVLEPTGEEPLAALIFTSVNYKTTLKGFGRQWYASLDTSAALWVRELSSSARSGRFGAYGAVAVVDEGHLVIAKQWGDIESHTAFSGDKKEVVEG